MSVTAGQRLPLEVFAGVHPPEHWDRIEESGRPHPGALAAAREGRKWERPALARPTLPWAELGALPRFVGSETTACIAALQPSIYHREGAEEFDRYVAATARRRETALIVSTIGHPEPDEFPRSVLSRFDDSVSLPGAGGFIGGRRLPAGAACELAEGLVGADRDLALRLLARPSPAPWWAIELQPSVLEGPHGTEVREPGGRIAPLLVNALGETLAGVWLPEDDRDWRWYVVPGGTDWQLLLRWLVGHAVPEFVPAGLRRSRSAELVDDELLTLEERTARDGLDRFDRESAATRASLEHAYQAARAAAGPIRHDLLYGTGATLVQAVAQVLTDAGFDVENLDETLGTGRSADLLAKLAERHCLIEVKSASGMPSEGLVADLDRHVRTWSALGRTEVIHRSALVINHDHALPPLSRATKPYSRPEFLSSLQYAVIPSLSLFGWWRDTRRHDIVRAFMEGPPICHAVDLTSRTSPVQPASEPALASNRTHPEPARRRWWRRSAGR